MTDLQLGLLLIGAAAVAGVLVYNRWQERGTRREAERAFAARHPDALLDEPARREPTLEPLPAPAHATALPPPDPRVDYVIELSGAAPAALESDFPALAQAFAPRASLQAQAAERARAVLQLVNRAAVVSEQELAEFRACVERLAAAQGATVVAAPEAGAALRAARALDAGCAEVDIQVALHVLGVPPDLALPGESTAPGATFQVAPREGGVTLTLDVPRTADFVEAFEAMVRSARGLVSAHGGRLADDNGRALDERGIAAIGTELEAVRGRFAELGIEPGSPLALRLFS
ncbi:MAG TPA: cell division protein ZipA C-terminal FtsZ-binding domain-containing protein [Burkholderiales bacterium]|nr:cell division protein ZipA C-terminal FtsZ-binding domain-containing protein [Burkholderiales bacterium]